MTVEIAEITSQTLDFAAHFAVVSHSGAGAVASFAGSVRDHDPEARDTVTKLEYSCHPSAPDVISQLAAQIDEKYGDEQLRIAISHRIGELAVGDLAIVCCVSSAHRAPAFDACRELVELVKHNLPIWKKQHTISGETAWVGVK